MLQVVILGSGSSGNSTLVRTARTSVLIDAGFSRRQLMLRMAACGWDPDKLDGILITHEHVDHIKGLDVLCSRHNVPVYATEETLADRELQYARLGAVEVVCAGEEFKIGDMTVRSFSVPHDAADPVGFVVSTDGLRYGHVTDAGCSTALVRHHLQGCHLLALETNHDPDMLVEGPYPWFLKQRIMSRIGHLSNPDAAELLADVVTPDLQALFLAHISRENNTPSLAREVCREALAERGLADTAEVIITDQFTPTEPFRLE